MHPERAGDHVASAEFYVWRASCAGAGTRQWVIATWAGARNPSKLKSSIVLTLAAAVITVGSCGYRVGGGRAPHLCISNFRPCSPLPSGFLAEKELSALAGGLGTAALENIKGYARRYANSALIAFTPRHVQL